MCIRFDMETLGKVLKIGNSEKVSVHKTTEYRRLNQDVTDDERDDDEDDVVFLRKGIELKHQNGFDVDHARVITDSDLDLKLHRRMKSVSDSVRITPGIVKKRMTRRKLTLVLFILLVALIIALVLVALSVRRHKLGYGQSWTQEFIEFEASSNAVLYDVDGDGIQDVIVSITASLNLTRRDFFSRTSTQLRELCMAKEGKFPCLGRIVAMRGRDSQLLWETTTVYGMTEVKCGVIDVDKDGSADCIASGHMNGLVAFNPVNGHVIWTSNSTSFKWGWMNVGFVSLMDLNSDNVPEIVVIQSSHDALRSNVSLSNNTDPQSMLLLIDGSSGAVIGRPLNLDSESQFPPLIYKFKDESTYILFGTGSLNEEGSLHAIGIKDFYSLVVTSMHITKPLVTDPTTFRGSYKGWPAFRRSGCIVEVYRSIVGGVNISPLIVDVDEDGTDDIVVASCDGNVTLLGGDEFKVVWSRSFPGYFPAGKLVAGHFNDDNFLDVFVHLNLKNSLLNLTLSPSFVAILDGLSGSILWSMNNTATELVATNMVASTFDVNRDFFLFWLRKQNFHESANRRKRYVKAEGSTYPRRTNYQKSRSRIPVYGDYSPVDGYQEDGRRSSHRYLPDDSPAYKDYNHIPDYRSELPDMGSVVYGISCPWDQLSMGSVVRGISCPGISCPGISCPGISSPGISSPGISCPGISCDDPEKPPDPNQPLPSRRRPYLQEYYDPSDLAYGGDYSRNQPLRRHYRTTRTPKVVRTTRLAVTNSTSASPNVIKIKPRCQPRVDYSILVGVDRFSAGDPFLISKEAPIPFGEMKEFLGKSYNRSLYALKPPDEMSSHWCYSAVVENVFSLLGDLDNDWNLDLVSIATVTKMAHDQEDMTSRATRTLRVSKINLEREIGDVINKRLESYSTQFISTSSFPSSFPSQPVATEIPILKASKPMTRSEVERYSDFKFRPYFQLIQQQQQEKI